MKKFTFIFAFVTLALGFSYSQATFIYTAPNNMTGSSFRLPNGTAAYANFRGATLVMPTEMAGVPVSTTLTSIGFTTTTGASSAVTGTITIYMQNTGDVTFNKGTAWTGITTGMTTVYTATMTVPATATSFDLPLSTPFVFLGSGVYVAYDWVSSGPFAGAACVWGSNSTLVSGCVAAASTSVSAPPTTLAFSNFRPSVRFGYTNTLTNDVSVEHIGAMGDVPMLVGTGPITAIVRNNSNGPLSNINVSVNISGANSFSDMKTVTSLAAGAIATVTFNPWTPLALGASTINVSVPADQNNGNNSRNFNNMVNCNTGGFAENPSVFTQNIGFAAASGILSTQVQLPVSATVTGVNMAISSNTPSVGRDVYGVMLDASGNILATSMNTLTIANGNLSTIYSFSFATPQSVTAGQIWYVGMAQTATAGFTYYPFGAYVSPYLNSAYYTNAITGGTVALLAANLGQFGITAEFAGICGPLGINNAVASSDNSLVVYPNPANTSVFVKLNAVSDKATVIVYNTIGQVVIDAKEFNDNSAEINVSALAKGVYILKITNGKEVSNVKIVVEH